MKRRGEGREEENESRRMRRRQVENRDELVFLPLSPSSQRVLLLICYHI